MDSDDNAPKSRFIHKVILTFFGIASLLGWNALLTKLDFFDYFLSDINPSRSFAFFNYALNITFQFLLIYKKDIFSHKFQLIAGILGSIVFLVLIPLCTMLLGQNAMINKIIVGGLLILMGFTNALCCSGFFSYAGHFPLDMIVVFTAGQGISGIGLNIIEFIVLASVNISDKEVQLIVRAWIFFGIGILILILCLILLFYSYNDEYCKYYLNISNQTESNPEKREIELLNNFDNDTLASNQEEGITKDVVETLDSENVNVNENDNLEIKFEPSFMYVFKKIWDLDVMACYAYIITFSLFPNACVAQKIFDLDTYNSVTIISIYNGFDTIGRYIIDRIKPTKTLNLIVGLGRTVLLITIILNYYFKEHGVDLTFTSIFLMINVAILGITNGMAGTLSFGLASRLSEDEIKGQAGGSISFFSILGIFLGSCFSFAVGAILDAIK